MLDAIEPFGLPLILVDDGSAAAELAALKAAVAGRPWVQLHQEPRNQGKGAAVMRGLQLAAARGFTHVVQIDADGQHRVADIEVMLDIARREPTAVVSGLPVYDASAPAARLHGRKIGIFWTRVHTWSRDILDPMCGFRVYPVRETLVVASTGRPGAGMEFDTEILVRAHWAGLPVRFTPTPVRYPVGGTSHFRLFFDNVRISAMHTRLFFGMLRRAPALLARRRRVVRA